MYTHTNITVDIPKTFPRRFENEDLGKSVNVSNVDIATHCLLFLE